MVEPFSLCSAHMHMMQLARSQFQFDRSLMLLSKTNVDKQITGATLPQRLEMMTILAQQEPNTDVGIAAPALGKNLIFV